MGAEPEELSDGDVIQMKGDNDAPSKPRRRGRRRRKRKVSTPEASSGQSNGLDLSVNLAPQVPENTVDDDGDVEVEAPSPPVRKIPFSYETESFTHNGEGGRRRPKKVTGSITRRATTSDRGANAFPIAFKDKDGVEDQDLNGYQRGHIVGLQNGGENISENVAAMTPRYNNPIYKNLEDEVHRDTSSKEIEVTLTYGEGDKRIPSSLTMKTYDRDGGLVMNETRTTSDADKEVPVASSEETAMLSRGRLDFMEFGNMNEAVLVQDFLRKAGRAFPIHYWNSPYHDLERIYFQRENGYRIEGGELFREEQKDLIYKANTLRNNGVLMSDDPNDPHPVLDMNGTNDRPEIDHILPKSRGGGNFFSNARVVSREMNNSLDRMKTDTMKREATLNNRRNQAKRTKGLIKFDLIRLFKAHPNEVHNVQGWRMLANQGFNYERPVDYKRSKNQRYMMDILTELKDELNLTISNSDGSDDIKVDTDISYNPNAMAVDS